MIDTTTTVEAPERQSRVATRGQIEAFVRGVLARSMHVFDCWLCAGKRFVREVNGKSAPKRCPECNGKGQVTSDAA